MKVGFVGLKIPQISCIFLQIIVLEKHVRHLKTMCEKNVLPCWNLAMERSSSARSVTSLPACWDFLTLHQQHTGVPWEIIVLHTLLPLRRAEVT